MSLPIRVSSTDNTWDAMACLLQFPSLDHTSIMLRSLKYYPYRLLMIATLLLYSCAATRPANVPVTEADVVKAIENGNWTFTVSQVMPQIGQSRQANGDYSVQYTANKLTVNLPYFGRANGGIDVYTGRGPLDFSIENVAINKEQVKPGEWRLQIQPVNGEVQLMDFTFYNNGRGYLAVRLNNRSPISYGGVVTPFISR